MQSTTYISDHLNNQQLGTPTQTGEYGSLSQTDPDGSYAQNYNKFNFRAKSLIEEIQDLFGRAGLDQVSKSGIGSLAAAGLISWGAWVAWKKWKENNK